MKRLVVTKKLFGIFPYRVTHPLPHIYKGSRGLWVCKAEGTYAGFGCTPADAWNDWAMWALI
jgi:hypothetical protein